MLENLKSLRRKLRYDFIHIIKSNGYRELPEYTQKRVNIILASIEIIDGMIECEQKLEKVS